MYTIYTVYKNHFLVNRIEQDSIKFDLIHYNGH